MKRTVVVVVAALFTWLALAGCAKKSDVQQMLDEQLTTLSNKLSAEIVEVQGRNQNLMKLTSRQGVEIDSLKNVLSALQADLAASRHRVKSLEKTADQVERLQANLEGLDQQTSVHLSEAETRWSERLSVLAQSQAATDERLAKLQADWQDGRTKLEIGLTRAQKRDPLIWPALATGVLSLGLHGLHVSQ